VSTPVYDGTRLEPGARIDGPAIALLANTTIVVPDSFGVVVDGAGSYVLFAAERETWVFERLATG
jgi:N-methylhydantoinase A/oxoprolinase/acetone carboxylase beta subunit